MGNALDAHPCVFDVGEGFGASEMLWTTAKIDECGDVKPPPAIFDTDSDSGSHKLISRENPKMEKKIDSVLTKKDNIGSGNLAEANHAKGVNYKSLYDDLEYDISEYLLRIRDLICENVPSDVCPEKQCTISTKMFPQFIDGITAMQLNKADLEPDIAKKKFLFAHTHDMDTVFTSASTGMNVVRVFKQAINLAIE